MTATEWANFFRQRCHPDAEIHFQTLACAIRDAFEASTPQQLKRWEWHTPYIQEDEQELDEKARLRVSVARCARVSYLTHDGKRSIAADLQLYERLANGSGFGHWSPFEHVAQAHYRREYLSGPFRGWRQYRKLFTAENVKG
jgi:thymidylate synthase ThyX